MEKSANQISPLHYVSVEMSKSNVWWGLFLILVVFGASLFYRHMYIETSWLQDFLSFETWERIITVISIITSSIAIVIMVVIGLIHNAAKKIVTPLYQFRHDIYSFVKFLNVSVHGSNYRTENSNCSMEDVTMHNLLLANISAANEVVDCIVKMDYVEKGGGTVWTPEMEKLKLVCAPMCYSGRNFDLDINFF